MKKRIVMAALAATMLIGMNASQAFIVAQLSRQKSEIFIMN